MTQDDGIQEKLTRVRALVTPAASFEDDVMRRISRLGPAGPGRVGRTRRILMKSTIGVAACTLLAVGAWVVLGTATPTLYAQAVKAIEQARTVHIVGRRLQDGKMVKSMEAFYERDVGVAEYSFREGATVFFRIDNGKYCWRKRGTGPLVQSRSRDQLGIVKKVFRDNAKALQGRKDVQRRPDGDRAVDGVPCRQYALLWSKGRLRTLIWIDGKNRWRRFDKQQPDGSGWQTYQTVAIRYDVPMDRSRFQVKIPPAATVVDAEKLLEGNFGLNNAIFRKELMGLIFAVHDLQRCDNGMIFIVCSTRPSRVVIRELGPSSPHGAAWYGDFQLDASWKRVDGKERYYQHITLGQLRHDGMDVKWLLLHPLGARPQPMETCELSAYVYTRGKLREKRTKAGRKWYKRFKPLAELPLPGQPVPLGEVIAKVHADALALEPVERQVYVFEAARLGEDGRWFHRSRFPSEISPKQFAEEVQCQFDQLERLRQQQAQRKAASGKAGG